MLVTICSVCQERKRCHRQEGSGRPRCVNCWRRERDRIPKLHACPKCGVERMVHRARVCGRCQGYRQYRRRLCAACGVLKNCARSHGRMLCRSCSVKLRPPRPCGGCGRKRYLQGGICMACSFKRAQAKRNRACTKCGRRPAFRLCATCNGREWRSNRPVRRCRECKRCRRVQSYGRCVTCYNRMVERRHVRQRFIEIAGGAETLQSPQLRRLLRYLLQLRSQSTVRRWINELSPVVAQFLRSTDRAKSMTTADVLDATLRSGDKRFFSHCERSGVIANAVPELFRVKAVITKLTRRAPPWVSLVLGQFWRFHLRPMIERRPFRCSQLDPRLKCDLALVQKIAKFLVDVDGANRTLADIDQEFVDKWLLQHRKTHRIFLRRFLAWAVASDLAIRGLEVPRLAGTPARGVALEVYRGAVRRALTDEDLSLTLRVAILFMTFFKRSVSEIASMRKKSIRPQPDEVHIAFTRGPVLSAAGTVGQLISRLHARAGVYLFPHATTPGTPVSAQHLRAQLRPLCGGNLRQFENAAIRDILNDYEAAEVAKILGFSASFAQEWKRRLGAVSRAVKEYLSAVPS